MLGEVTLTVEVKSEDFRHSLTVQRDVECTAERLRQVIGELSRAMDAALERDCKVVR